MIWNKISNIKEKILVNPWYDQDWKGNNIEIDIV